jgi:amicyanin
MPSSSAGASVAGAELKIAAFAFSPSEIQVSAGNEVSWMNEDAAPHAIAVKGGVRTAQLAPGQRAALAFDKPGTYDYICSIHPYMTGKVVVRP